MKLLKAKTIRFSQIVEKCGEPNVYTLWEKPAADRRFQAQPKNNRLMTVEKSESPCREPANQRSAIGNAYAILSRWPGQRAFAKKMYMQMRNTFTCIRS